MKVAIISESSADESGLRLLVEAVLDRPTELFDLPLRTRGWPSVLDILPAVLKRLHYHTDAEAFAVVVDSDRTAIHRDAHEAREPPPEDCRLCLLRSVLSRAQAQLRPRAHLPPLKTALGLAVPSVEAWYLTGHNPQVSEAQWARGLLSRSLPYSVNALKREVYGTDRPSLALETERAVAEVRRLASERRLEELADAFPGGFGSFVRELRTWTSQSP